MTFKEVKTKLADALTHGADTVFLSKGFKRRKGSLVYKQNFDKATHELTLAIDYKPTDNIGAIARILPIFTIQIPEVSEMALSIVQGDQFLLADAPEVVLNQPLDFAVPHEKQERWYISSEDNTLEVSKAIQSFYELYKDAYLPSFKSAGELVSTYEDGDNRILAQHHWYIFVTAAYVLLGKEAEAKEVLVKHLGAAGLRRRFAPAFSYFSLS